MKRTKANHGRFAVALSCMVALGQSALADESAQMGAPKVEGWTIAPVGDGSTCLASGPTDAGASLSLGAQGKGLGMLVRAPDFPRSQASFAATLVFDDRPPETTAAVDYGGAMQFMINPREPTWRLMTSKTVTVTVAGQTHSFPLSNVTAAMDGLARCVGQPTIAERMDQPDQPIPGTVAWRIMVTLPNVPRKVCNAEARGDGIDLLLAMSPNGGVSLMARHWDWANWGRAMAPLQLSIDGGPPLSLEADPIDNQILIWVKDKALLRRLRAARTLDWMLPTGQAHVDVTGFGVAQDAVWACLSRKEPRRRAAVTVTVKGVSN